MIVSYLDTIHACYTTKNHNNWKKSQACIGKYRMLHQNLSLFCGIKLNFLHKQNHAQQMLFSKVSVTSQFEILKRTQGLAPHLYRWAKLQF